MMEHRHHNVSAGARGDVDVATDCNFMDVFIDFFSAHSSEYFETKITLPPFIAILDGGNNCSSTHLLQTRIICILTLSFKKNEFLYKRSETIRVIFICSRLRE